MRTLTLVTSRRYNISFYNMQGLCVESRQVRHFSNNEAIGAMDNCPTPTAGASAIALGGQRIPGRGSFRGAAVSRTP